MSESNMTTAIGFIVILIIYWIICLMGHGYANVIDNLAWYLHRHAESTRKRHAERTLVIMNRWINKG